MDEIGIRPVHNKNDNYNIKSMLVSTNQLTSNLGVFSLAGIILFLCISIEVLVWTSLDLCHGLRSRIVILMTNSGDHTEKHTLTHNIDKNGKRMRENTGHKYTELTKGTQELIDGQQVNLMTKSNTQEN